MTTGPNNIDIERLRPFTTPLSGLGGKYFWGCGKNTSEDREASGKVPLLFPVGASDVDSLSGAWQLWFDVSACAGLWAVLCAVEDRLGEFAQASSSLVFSSIPLAPSISHIHSEACHRMWLIPYTITAGPYSTPSWDLLRLTLARDGLVHSLATNPVHRTETNTIFGVGADTELVCTGRPQYSIIAFHALHPAVYGSTEYNIHTTLCIL